MSQGANIADIVIHLHPDSSCDDWTQVEQELRAHDGVVSVHFNEQDQPHAMVVAYNADVITSDAILADVRTCDSKAVMAGL